MSPLSSSDLEKIQLLDELFFRLDIDQLQSLAETESILSKLKGKDGNGSQILRKIVDDQTTLEVEIMNLRAQHESLKSDFQHLIQVLNRTVFNYSSDFNNIKQKHNIY